MSERWRVPIIVNLRKYKGSDYVLIDRRTQFGNPNRIGAWSERLQRHMSRADTVMLFREQFEERMKTEPSYRVRVEGLRGKKIACWCTPLQCHGDVYVEYFENGPWW